MHARGRADTPHRPVAGLAAAAVRLVADGNLLVAGNPSAGSIGGSDLFVMANGDDGVSDACAPNGDVLLGGQFIGTVDFGGGNITSVSTDGFALRRAP